MIEITSLYPEVHTYCKEYVWDGESDFGVTTTLEDIAFERAQSAREDEIEHRQVRHYSDGYLEELAVYRKIAERMLDYKTFLFHSSVIAVDNKAYLFTARSGTGKSTHTRLWRELLGERAVMVNDDKPLIRVGRDGVFVYGTPYNGKHRIGSNICVPLKAVAVLERSETNQIERIELTEAYPILLQQVYRPSDAQKMLITMQLINEFAERTALYRLGCNMEIQAARIAYSGMR